MEGKALWELNPENGQKLMLMLFSVLSFSPLLGNPQGYLFVFLSVRSKKKRWP